MSNPSSTCCQGNCDTTKSQTDNVVTEKNSSILNNVDAKVFVPQVDIVESEDRIVLVADLPGVDQDHLDITLEKNVLTLKGTVAPYAPEGYQLAYSEYAVGNFERAFTVSNDIDRQGIEAVVKDGVLTLTLSKAKHAVVQKIAVKTA